MVPGLGLVRKRLRTWYERNLGASLRTLLYRSGKGGARDAAVEATGAGLRHTQVSENNECTSSEPGGRARQPESRRRHCRLSRACRRENPRSIRLRGPEQQVHSDLPVRGRRRSWPRQPTWVLHNFSARAIQRTTSPAMLLVLTGSAIVWRAAAAQSRVLTP